MNNKIYLKGIKSLKNTVLSVDSNGQKTYFDPTYSRLCGYASGSQVKRCIREHFVSVLGTQLSPVELNYKVDSGAIKQNTSIDNSDPNNLDSVLCGWMSTDQGLTRTSPLMISPFTPVHPLLSSINKEIHTFDRTSNTNSVKISLTNDKKIMSENELKEFLKENDRNFPKFLMTPETHVTGLYEYSVGIDLRTLCTVQLNHLNKQINDDTIDNLLLKGWMKGKNYFGDCLIMPKKDRIELIEALSESLIEWTIGTHQSFNHNACLTEAVSISYNSRLANSAIRPEETSDMIDEKENSKINLIFDKNYADNVFVESSAIYIKNSAAIAKPNAMEDAKEQLKKMMLDYDYEQFITE